MRTDPHEKHTHQLARLGDLSDYEVSDDDPDVRGWDVVDRQGISLGSVDELIVDQDALKVRYLSVQLDRSTGATQPYRLIPVGLATLDESEDVVILKSMNIQNLMNCPVYDGSHITREFEQRLLVTSGVTPSSDKTPNPRGFYDEEHFDQDRFYGTRRKTTRRNLH